MPTFYEHLATQATAVDACFLCGRTAREVEITQEHVIPQWAQRRFDLWNHPIGLINGTAIQYRRLTIPCCVECNNLKLRALEDAVADASARGPDAMRALPPTTIFLWLAKLLYGLLYRELFLAADRRNPHSGTIVAPEFLRNFELLHGFLQASRADYSFSNLPASLLIVNTQAPADRAAQWDFRDSVYTQFVAVRMGKVAVLGCLMDGGAQQPILDDLRADLPEPLHPIQYLELAACVAYTGSLLNRIPKFMITGESPMHVVQLPLGGLSAQPVFDEWDDEQYSKLLAAYVDVDLDTIYQPPRAPMTWLRGPHGTRHISLEQLPWPPV